jgi:hypothetical protein
MPRGVVVLVSILRLAVRNEGMALRKTVEKGSRFRRAIPSLRTASRRMEIRTTTPLGI